VVSEVRGDLGELMMLTGGEGGSGDTEDGLRRSEARSCVTAMVRFMEE
jgi:hypothetical protein